MNFIKYQNNVICRNCKYYIKPVKHTTGKCQLFGQKNLETGEIHYLDTHYTRLDAVLGESTKFTKTCGTDGIYFEEYFDDDETKNEIVLKK